MTRRLREQFRLAIAWFAARPRNQPMWTCSKCGTANEAWRSYCMNGCQTAGPLAPRRATP